MANPRDNKTDTERDRCDNLFHESYIYLLIYRFQSAVTSTRLWFRRLEDRAEFIRLVIELNGTAVIPEE